MTAPALKRLIEELDAAAALPAGRLESGVTAALAHALESNDWLPAERRRASYASYARHLLHADPAGRYSLLALVWEPGQASPIHDHRTWCAVGVYAGELTEIVYEPAADGTPRPLRAAPRCAASVSFDPAGNGAHRLGNERKAPAISLHVYGVGADRVATGINRILG